MNRSLPFRPQTLVAHNLNPRRNQIKTRNLGAGLGATSAIGLGCMGMSEFYGPTRRDQSYETLDRALELGVTFYDTADIYGNGANETLLSDFVRQNRNQITLSTKFAIIRSDDPTSRFIDTSPTYVKQAVEASLKRLGIEQIDLYYAHRLDGITPVEDTVGAMADLVKEGKIRGIGLSEVSAQTLRRAHAVHPVGAVQTEYSLWSRDPEVEMLSTCAELGTAFVPYSPLGRGFLTGKVTTLSELAEDDFRRTQPRFGEGNLAKNLEFLNEYYAIAESVECSPAQLALAWVLAQGEHIIPIPGTKRRSYLEDNVGAANVTLNKDILARLDALFPRGVAAGERYTEQGMQMTGL